jgi:hypothetical protein
VLRCGRGVTLDVGVAKIPRFTGVYHRVVSDALPARCPPAEDHLTGVEAALPHGSSPLVRVPIPRRGHAPAKG